MAKPVASHKTNDLFCVSVKRNGDWVRENVSGKDAAMAIVAACDSDYSVHVVTHTHDWDDGSTTRTIGEYIAMRSGDIVLGETPVAKPVARLVTRKTISKPNNSKSPGGSHHVSIDSARFAATKEQRGSGWATAEVAVDSATIEVAATYMVGKMGKKERISTKADVIVTGDESDTLTLAAEYTSSQSLVVEFRGVKLAEAT